MTKQNKNIKRAYTKPEITEHTMDTSVSLAMQSIPGDGDNDGDGYETGPNAASASSDVFPDQVSPFPDKPVY